MIAKLLHKYRNVAPLLLRLLAGAEFLYHGVPKISHFEGTIAMVQGIGFPLPEFFAIVLIAFEVVGGAFLILGLFTRYVAIGLAFDMAVAITTIHLQKGGVEFPLALGVICLSLIFSGAGALSLERGIFKREL